MAAVTGKGQRRNALDAHHRARQPRGRLSGKAGTVRRPEIHGFDLLAGRGAGRADPDIDEGGQVPEADGAVVLARLAGMETERLAGEGRRPDIAPLFGGKDDVQVPVGGAVRHIGVERIDRRPVRDRHGGGGLDHPVAGLFRRLSRQGRPGDQEQTDLVACLQRKAASLQAPGIGKREAVFIDFGTGDGFLAGKAEQDGQEGRQEREPGFHGMFMFLRAKISLVLRKGKNLRRND